MINDRATDAVAYGAVTSPLWLPTLSDISQVASTMLPIFGLLWIIVQIYFKFREKK